MSRRAFWPCLKCGAPSTLDSAETDTPLCFAHGGGEAPEIEPDDFLTQVHSDEVDSYLTTDMPREVDA